MPSAPLLSRRCLISPGIHRSRGRCGAGDVGVPQAVTINDIFTEAQDKNRHELPVYVNVSDCGMDYQQDDPQKMLQIISTKPARYVIHPDAMKKFWEDA